VGNKTEVGLVENEVTRRGNSPERKGPRSRSNEGSNERAEGWKKNHVKYLFPHGASGVAEKNRQIKRNSSGDSERILSGTNTRGNTFAQSYDSIFAVSFTLDNVQRILSKDIRYKAIPCFLKLNIYP